MMRGQRWLGKSMLWQAFSEDMSDFRENTSSAILDVNRCNTRDLLPVLFLTQRSV